MGFSNISQNTEEMRWQGTGTGAGAGAGGVAKLDDNTEGQTVFATERSNESTSIHFVDK